MRLPCHAGESMPREWKRAIAANSAAIVLATFRPVDDQVKKEEWVEKIESCLEEVTVVIDYSFFSFVTFTKSFTLYASTPEPQPTK